MESINTPIPANGSEHGASTLDAVLASLTTMTGPQLRLEYVRVFGEAPASNNRVWLLKRIAWRVQSLAEGDLSERARKRAAELARDADLRLTPPVTRPYPIVHQPSQAKSPRRLLRPGTVIRRPYKGAVLEVKVLAQGFQYQGAIYRSLSAVAKTITGSHCSGYGFFHIPKTERNRHEPIAS